MVVIFLKVVEINSLVLAYLGDTIYENYVRRFLIAQGYGHVDELQKQAVKYVSAKRQATYLQEMINENFFSDEELNIIKRARNYKTTSHPKNCDIVTYKNATGLEALIGYLDMDDRKERVKEIMKFILEECQC